MNKLIDESWSVALNSLFHSRTSTIIKKIEFPSLGPSEINFGGPNYDQIFVTSARILVNPYGGGVLQNRSQDATLYKVEGLNARGFDTPSVRLGSSSCEHNKCCSKWKILEPKFFLNSWRNIEARHFLFFLLNQYLSIRSYLFYLLLLTSNKSRFHLK